LTATVKDLRRRGPTPIGSVTFLDGTAGLGTVALRHGTARLKTSSLQLGPDIIQAQYMPSPGFAPSTATIVENVEGYQLRRKAARSAEIGKRVVAATPMAIRRGGAAAIPVGAVAIVGGPTVLGPIGPDQGRTARSDGIPAATRHIRAAPAGTDNGVPARPVRRKQVADQSIPAALTVAGMRPRPDVDR
jgi:hypothetical protein